MQPWRKSLITLPTWMQGSILWKNSSECIGEMIENLVLDVELHRDMLLTMTQGHSQNNVTIDSKALDEDSIKPPAKSII